MKYWLVKHDKESIKSRPGWIWTEIEDSRRVPPNYRQVKNGDKFILYAYKTSGGTNSEPCQEIYGFYEVAHELQEENLDEGLHWTIKGNLLPEHKQGWVPIQDLAQFFERKKFNQQAVTELTRVEFERFLQEYEKS
jgi:EVE domain